MAEFMGMPITEREDLPAGVIFMTPRQKPNETDDDWLMRSAFIHNIGNKKQ